MLHKLQGTPGVGHTFQIVALSVGEVVHGVGIPLISGTDMGDVQHTIDQRVAEQHVGMGHIDLGSQHEGSGLAFATVHKLEEFQILLHRTIAEGTVRTRTGGRTLLLGNHLGTLFVDVSTSLLDEPYGKVPELLEIVAGIVDVSPLESQPFDIVLNALDIFRILLDRVGVVKTEVTDTIVFLGQSEVDGNGLGMSDMQITIGLWWETRLHPTTVLAFCQVIDHFLLNKTH